MPHYRQKTSQHAERLATFRQQMADFARAERLKELREQRHLSQEEAAHEIGVSVKSLRAWEKGGGIRWLNAKSVAEFYGVDPESLVTREQGAEPVAPAFANGSAATADELMTEIRALRQELLAEIGKVQTALAARRPRQASGGRGKAANGS